MGKSIVDWFYKARLHGTSRKKQSLYRPIIGYPQWIGFTRREGYMVPAGKNDHCTGLLLDIYSGLVLQGEKVTWYQQEKTITVQAYYWIYIVDWFYKARRLHGTSRKKRSLYRPITGYP